MGQEPDRSDVFPGADERTPSRAQYFSWINNTNEGAGEEQTRANLEFFRWLRDEYGMELDIYAFDAGAVDGAKYYGSTGSERFKRRFPRGFGPLAEAAFAFGCRLGLWCGPDGFGDSPEQERARIAMMEGFCRDNRFALFKMDAVCGQLRRERQDAFVEMMTRCRKHSPDLILLNHRLDLGKGLAHATTFLWGGEETYIDVHMANAAPASHNRACVLARGLPPGLRRLTEDHGVCLSSCLDYWEDDLVLQAFNRCLILAPEIYGNPWLLRDDEYPRLARLFNLHRRWRDILVAGMALPEDRYGPKAVARGDGGTRLLTFRNPSWEPVRYRVALDATIGLVDKKRVEVRRLHPAERVLGEFDYGATVDVEVLPWRACLVAVCAAGANPEPAVTGCEYEVVRDVKDRPLRIRLLGEPGGAAPVALKCPGRTVTGVLLDGAPAPGLLDGRAMRIEFPGVPLRQPWHRKLGDLAPVDVPSDAEALYEATCFAADNNALEVRELLRSGPTAIPQVQRARDAFFGQAVFRRRHLCDRNLFDDDPETGFAVCRRWWDLRIRGGGFRLDLGKPEYLDRIVLETGGDYFLQPLKSEEGAWGSVSADLATWTPVLFFAHDHLEASLPANVPIRYLRLGGSPDLIRHVRGYCRGQALDRSLWRASNLFGNYAAAPAVKAWSLRFPLDEAATGSYFAVGVHGRCGNEAVYVAMRVGQEYAGAPRRSPSYPSNVWEYAVRRVEGNYTYYIPVNPAMVGKSLEIVALLLKGGIPDVRIDAWITAYPAPLAARELEVRS